ncbi:MAG: hypothetical protein HYW91_02140 [Candidatus Sungbacteria bacterium]|nr:hypothetical protein [Candidatus Sungbacteria bacterium]
MAEAKSSSKNLWLIIFLLVVVAVQIMWTPQTAVAIFTMAALAYLQNITFSLTSRARTRNHAPYHFIASVSASLVWFLTFRTLVLAKMSIELAIPYTCFTVLGSLTGAQLSMWIERHIGAFADEDTMSKDERALLEQRRIEERKRHWYTRVWYSGEGKVKTSPFFCIFGTLSAVQMIFASLPLGWTLMLLLAAGFVRDMSYGMRTWVQNRNNQSLLLVVNIFSAGAEFFAWGGLFNMEMPWALFLPYTAVSTGGSLFGTFVASWAGKKLGASADAHVKKGEMPKFSRIPYYILGLVMAVQLLFFNPYGIYFVLLVIAGSFMRSVAYAMVSRSRNRNHMGYHYVSSLLSNGLYFVTLYWFVLKNLDPVLSIPFVSASIIGGLLAVEVAMHVEKRIGAVADAHALKPQKA